MDVKKTIGPDRTYIDYMHGNSGCRVRKSTCQRIERCDENAPWYERNPVEPLPIDDRFQGTVPLRPNPLWLITFSDNVQAHANGRELRKLLRGGLSFEELWALDLTTR